MIPLAGTDSVRCSDGYNSNSLKNLFYYLLLFMKTAKQKLLSWISSQIRLSLKYIYMGLMIGFGIFLAYMGSYAFQVWTVSLTWTWTADSSNNSLKSPMLTVSGWIYDRNYYSLEAIANFLWLINPSSPPVNSATKRVFMTSATYHWWMYSYNAGWPDALCQAVATSKSLGWTWISTVWLSGSPVKSRVSTAFKNAVWLKNLKWELIFWCGQPWWLFGMQCAKTSSDYVLKPLLTNENQVYVGLNTPFWSASNMYWDLNSTGNGWNYNCTYWTDGSSSNTGDYTANWVTWLYPWTYSTFFSGWGFYNSNHCNTYRSLLCIEQ